MSIALITGGGGDIGGATAKTLAEQGHRVVINYRNSAARADDVVAAIVAAGGEAIAIKADVTDANDVAAMVNEVNQRWGEIDVLVHSALTPYVITSFADLSWEQLGGKLDTELHAAFVVQGCCTRHDVAWQRTADLYECPAIHSCAGRDDHTGDFQGGPGSVRTAHRA
ncbi:hypothetical protein PPGU19_086250 (plasmid) [Paraburkholderia sp. PGU19]|nr:hypothetical protein PPGU19_086250 [Paraburkholderia sp. PGU19]